MTPLPVSLPDTEVHSLSSSQVGDDFELWIARPRAGFVPTDAPPKILWVLDANLFFGTAVEMTRLMHVLYGELPQILVAGIAYPTDDGMRQSMLRTRDFTPSDDPGMAAMAASMPKPPGAPEPVTPAMGGAGAFRSFLAEDALPFVVDRYETDPGGSAIFGSSLGGLFVVDTLLDAPEMFDAYLAVSPALWWNDAVLLDEVPGPPAGATPPSVWLASGALEEAAHVPMLARFRLISNARSMAEGLVEAGWPADSTSFREIADETHTSVVPAALTRGLRAIWGPRKDSQS